MGLKYKTLTPDVITGFDQQLRGEYSDRDVFFVGSAAFLCGLSEGTFRNYLRTDPTLAFIEWLPGGQIKTCGASCSAWRENRVDRRTQSSPAYRFTGGWTSNCGGGSPLL